MGGPYSNLTGVLITGGHLDTQRNAKNACAQARRQPSMSQGENPQKKTNTAGVTWMAQSVKFRLPRGS